MGTQPAWIPRVIINILLAGVMRHHPEGVIWGETLRETQHTQKSALVIAHNKTLAAQLYSEFKEFFPQNLVNFHIANRAITQPGAV